jgi:hypothetical protein
MMVLLTVLLGIYKDICAEPSALGGYLLVCVFTILRTSCLSLSSAKCGSLKNPLCQKSALTIFH